MLAAVLRTSAGKDPCSAAPLAAVFQLSPTDACNLADASAGQKSQAQREPGPSRSPRFDNAPPEQPDFIVRQNTPANILDPAFFQAMAGVGLDDSGIHPESENRARQGLNAVRECRLAVQYQPFDQLDHITTHDR